MMLAQVRVGLSRQSTSVTSHHVTSCHAMSYHATPCHIVSCHVIMSGVTCCDVIQCHINNMMSVPVPVLHCAVLCCACITRHAVVPVLQHGTLGERDSMCPCSAMAMLGFITQTSHDRLHRWDMNSPCGGGSPAMQACADSASIPQFTCAHVHADDQGTMQHTPHTSLQ